MKKMDDIDSDPLVMPSVQHTLVPVISTTNILVLICTTYLFCPLLLIYYFKYCLPWLHGRWGKGMADSFLREKLRHAPQKEGGWEILCDLPPVWPRLVRPTNLMSRMNRKKTHTTHMQQTWKEKPGTFSPDWRLLYCRYLKGLHSRGCHPKSLCNVRRDWHSQFRQWCICFLFPRSFP